MIAEFGWAAHWKQNQIGNTLSTVAMTEVDVSPDTSYNARRHRQTDRQTDRLAARRGAVRRSPNNQWSELGPRQERSDNTKAGVVNHDPTKQNLHVWRNKVVLCCLSCVLLVRITWTPFWSLLLFGSFRLTTVYNSHSDSWFCTTLFNSKSLKWLPYFNRSFITAITRVACTFTSWQNAQLFLTGSRNILEGQTVPERFRDTQFVTGATRWSLCSCEPIWSKHQRLQKWGKLPNTCLAPATLKNKLNYYEVST
jgi:hypothetical protein